MVCYILLVNNKNDHRNISKKQVKKNEKSVEEEMKVEVNARKNNEIVEEVGTIKEKKELVKVELHKQKYKT